MEKKDTIPPLQELSEMFIENMLVVNRVKQFVEDLRKFYEKKIESESICNFNMGVSMAVSLILQYGMKDLAEQIFRDAGIDSIQELIDCGVSGYDLETIERSGILNK